MRFTRWAATALAALSIASAAPASAQLRFGRGIQPPAGACFYEDSNFRGDYFCVEAGSDVREVPRGTNDRISSIRVLGDADVVVFQNSRFRGQSARFTSDIRNLQREGWNDLISSIRVVPQRDVRDRRDRRDRRESRDQNGRPIWAPGGPMPREGACFYSEPDFRGATFCVPRGGSYAELPPGFNDRVSSVRVRRSTVMLFEDRDFDGRSRRIDDDVRDLRGRWDNRLSSVRVF